MPSIEVKNLLGEKVEQLQLSEAVFGQKVNDVLVHQAYNAIYSNKRESIAHAKTRAERAGSGKKPWKQKGTGRARVGSVRTPVWKKGGVVFGPRNERNFSKKINKKMNQAAIRMVLSGKLADHQMVVVENFDLKAKKTKEMASVLAKLKLSGSTLMVFFGSEKEVGRYSRNLKKVINIGVDKLNVYDMLNNKCLVLSKESIKHLEDKYSK